MGKNSNKRGRWKKLNDFAALPVIGLIGFLLWSKLDDISDDTDYNRDRIEATRSDLAGLRLDIVRIHPQIGLAAYSISSSANDIAAAEIPEVFDTLLGLNLATDLETVASRLRRVESLNDVQIDRIANAYASLDPNNVDNWSPQQRIAVLRGLELANPSPMFLAAYADPPLVTAFEAVSKYILWALFAAAILLPIGYFIERQLTDDEESGE